MKITDIKTYVVENLPPHYGGPYWVFLKMTTDNGVIGFGEAYSVPFHPQIVARMIEDVFERYVAGFSKPRRLPVWPKHTMPRLHRICIAGRLKVPPTFKLTPAALIS